MATAVVGPVAPPVIMLDETRYNRFYEQQQAVSTSADNKPCSRITKPNWRAIESKNRGNRSPLGSCTQWPSTCGSTGTWHGPVPCAREHSCPVSTRGRKVPSERCLRQGRRNPPTERQYGNDAGFRSSQRHITSGRSIVEMEVGELARLQGGA